MLVYIKSLWKPKARLRFSNGKKEITLTPHYYNETSIKYYIVPYPEISQFDHYHDLGETYQKRHENDNKFVLSFRLSNIGKLLLENYRVEIVWGKGLQSISHISNKPRKVIGNYIEPEEQSDITIDRRKPQIIYSPLDRSPLNQQDFRDFSIRFTPHPDAKEVVWYWRINARDFSSRGELVIHLKPKITEYDRIIPVYSQSEIPEGAEQIEDLTPYIKQFEDLLKEE